MSSDDTREPEPPKPLLRVALMADGTIEMWTDRERSPHDLAAVMRSMAQAFENGNVTRVR